MKQKKSRLHATDDAVMRAAYSLCPTDLTHLDRMRWMAKYFRSHAAPVVKTPGLKIYTTRDESAGYVAAENANLSLLGVNEITDWEAEDFDQISEMAVGDKLDFAGITVERTA